MAYLEIMHEISLAASILDIAEQELRAHGGTRLLALRVRCGVLSSVVPDAMRMAIEALTRGTPHEGARLDLVDEALSLRCRQCGHIVESSNKEAVFHPCPACSTPAGYTVEKGEGVFLDHLEAE